MVLKCPECGAEFLDNEQEYLDLHRKQNHGLAYKPRPWQEAIKLKEPEVTYEKEELLRLSFKTEVDIEDELLAEKEYKILSDKLRAVGMPEWASRVWKIKEDESRHAAELADLLIVLQKELIRIEEA